MVLNVKLLLLVDSDRGSGNTCSKRIWSDFFLFENFPSPCEACSPNEMSALIILYNMFKMEQIGKELDLLPPPPTEEEQQHMTRMQTAELAKNESMKKRLNQRLEELRITLPDQLQLVKVA